MRDGSLHREMTILGFSAPSEYGPSLQPHLDSIQSIVLCNPEMTSELCHVYLSQVDPIIKILHRPSLEKLLLHSGRYLAYPDGHASVEALSSAVLYSAASSMTEEQCRKLFQADKSSIVGSFRRACEVAIERSSVLTTRDITVLQAFVLYLVSGH